MCRYYTLNNKSEIKYIGDYESFDAAWYVADYEENDSFLYIFDEDTLWKLSDDIKLKLSDNYLESVAATGSTLIN